MTYSWEYKGYDPINLLKWIGSVGVPGYIKLIPQKSGPRTYRIHQTKERIQLPHLDHIEWGTERMMAPTIYNLTSSACMKGWTGKRTPACPRGFSLALVPTADVAYSNCHPPVHLCTTWNCCPSIYVDPDLPCTSPSPWSSILTLHLDATASNQHPQILLDLGFVCITSPPLSPLYVSIRFQICPLRSLKSFNNLHTQLFISINAMYAFTMWCVMCDLKVNISNWGYQWKQYYLANCCQWYHYDLWIYCYLINSDIMEKHNHVCLRFQHRELTTPIYLVVCRTRQGEW